MASTGLATVLLFILASGACSGGDEGDATVDTERPEVGGRDESTFESSPEASDDPMAAPNIQAALEAALPAVEIVLVTTSVSTDDVIVTVSLDERSADPLEVCAVTVDHLDRVNGDDSTAVRIARDPGTTLAERKPGRVCAA